jgi:hypothetical protein
LALKTVQALLGSLRPKAPPPTSLQLVQDSMEALQPRGTLPEVNLPTVRIADCAAPDDGAASVEELIERMQRGLKSEEPPR